MSDATVFVAAAQREPHNGAYVCGYHSKGRAPSREAESRTPPRGPRAGSQPGRDPRAAGRRSPGRPSSPRHVPEPPQAPPPERPCVSGRAEAEAEAEAEALALPRPGGGSRSGGRTATVAREVEEEVGLALKPDPDPVPCRRVGESPTGLERSAGREAPTDLTAKMKPDETPMFDPSLLKEVDWSQNTATFSPAISPTYPGEGLVLRPLCTADLNRGFFKVLGQLTETGVVNPEQFMKSFEHMKKSGDYYVTVVEDVTLGQIVATATLIIEHKFIHSCAKRGRVEDVVVSDECRGKQLGKLLLSTLTLLSKKLNCYKITLECLPQNVGFYKKFGYTVSEENYMCRRFLK